MSLAVSVVVPFFNAGANIVDCLDSLLNQTLARDEFEIVLVDDGSTDGTPQRVERVRAGSPDLIRVERIPASGWAGAPRNRGVDCARGDYIQFVDADDSLHPQALERLLSIATSSDADIVIGKLSSDFRTLNHPIYRHTLTGRTIRNFPLVESLTPHKMFRRSLLIEHGIRFAEGPRHVEDEHFCMQAYTVASSVAIVGDLNCYFYNRRRTAGRNLGDTAAVPSEYYRDLAAILDVIDRRVPDPADRIPLQRRFYRVEMLGRLRGRQMLNYTADYRDDVLQHVRALAASRFDPSVRSGLPFFIRAQSHLMLAGDVAGLRSYAEWIESLRLRAFTTAPYWDERGLHLDIDAALYVDEVPLQLEPVGSDWAVPESAAAGVGIDDRIVTAADLATADVDCATVSRADASQWSTTDGLAFAIQPDGTATVRGAVTIDPRTVMGGGPLASGLWDIRLRVVVGGLTRSSPLRPASAPEGPMPAWITPADGRCVAAYWTEPNPTVALDVDEWSHPLHDLVTDTAELTIRRRRIEIEVPAIAGGPASRPAELVLEPADAAGPALVCPARLRATPDGARLRARLPRRSGRDDRWRLWVRIGAAGGPPPRALHLELRRERRRYQAAEIG